MGVEATRFAAMRTLIDRLPAASSRWRRHSFFSSSWEPTETIANDARIDDAGMPEQGGRRTAIEVGPSVGERQAAAPGSGPPVAAEE
jgi:hypothetical protein